MSVFEPVYNLISNTSVICEAHMLYSDHACLAVGHHPPKTPATRQSRTPQNRYIGVRSGMVLGVKQGQMEKQLLELLHQQQLTQDEGPAKGATPRKNFGSKLMMYQSNMKWHRNHLVKSYPQCSLEVLRRDGYRQLAEDGMDECKLPAKLYCLVKVQRQREEENFIETKELMHILRCEHLQERRQPEHLQEKRQPGPVLRKSQPKQKPEERQLELMQDNIQPQQILELLTGFSVMLIVMVHFCIV